MTDPLNNAAQLAAWLQATDIDLLELCGPSGTLRLSRRECGVVQESIAEPEASGPAVVVRAPGVGVFLDRHPLRLQPLAPIGVEARAGEPIGFLRIGPLVTAVSAPLGGVIADVLAQHGAVVGFGTPLFELEPIESAAQP